MNHFPIVAVACSGADLGPVLELLSALPPTWSEVFIIVNCFDPARGDMLLHEAVARATSHPVLLADDGVIPERGHLYVTRTNVTLTIVGGRIRESPGANRVQGPADVLFSSVAADRGASAIGVVLSGSGSDGALGIRAIKKVGGATFAQYPGSARFPGMPISAIETGCVGSVLRPNEIAHELTRLSRLHIRPDDARRPVSLIEGWSVAS
jgi:two-component system, chemotaxis family, CheB/CheR fusion protein